MKYTWIVAVMVGMFWGSAAATYRLLSVGGSELCYKYLQLPLPPLGN